MSSSLKPPQVSPSARRVVRDAFVELERVLSPADRNSFKSTTLADVRKAAIDIENQLAARQSLRNMRRLMPLFAGLEHYHGAIEILCNGTPFLPWAWAPVKLILQLSSEHVEAFDNIVEAYSRIGETLVRFEVLRQVFEGNDSFQQTLAIFLSDTVKFHKEAYKFVRRSSWKLFFRTSWGRFQRHYNHILDDLKRHEELVDKEANAHNIATVHSMRDEITSWRTESLNKIARDDVEHSNFQYQSILAWLKMSNSVAEQSLIADAIADEIMRFPGTCSWVLKNKKILTWLHDQADGSYLWVKGKPGSGKSVIATQLANFLRQNKAFTMIRHLCSYSYCDSLKYDRVIASLICQLLHDNQDAVAYIYGEYILGKKTASNTVLEQVLISLLSTMSIDPSRPVYIRIILDGLDECDEDTQQRLLTTVNRIISANSSLVIAKVLVSCRDTARLSRSLSKKSTMSLYDETQSLESAITSYTNQKLLSMKHKCDELGLADSDVSDIEAKIVQKADGMFLWARLVLEYLKNSIFFSREEMLEAVDALPRKLSDFYKRVLNQVTNGFEEPSIKKLKLILGWVAFAKRPLRAYELRSALAFSSGKKSVQDAPPESALHECKPLIQRSQDSTYSFIHISVADYLKGSESGFFLELETAKRQQTLACITCLVSISSIFEPGFTPEDRAQRIARGLYGFLPYVMDSWISNLAGLKGESQEREAARATEAIVGLTYELLYTTSSVEESTSTASTSFNSQWLVSPGHILIFRQHPKLRIYISKEMTAREQRDKEILGNNGGAPSQSKIQGISETYESLVQEFLVADYVPGVSKELLQAFKESFGQSAYTCRFSRCQRRSLGFDSAKKRADHERIHSQLLRCTHPGCAYPLPFRDTNGLKAHLQRYHAIERSAPRKAGLNRVRSARASSSAQMNSLSDEAMQLMLLETQNRKRLKLARQEEKEILERQRIRELIKRQSGLGEASDQQHSEQPRQSVLDTSLSLPEEEQRNATPETPILHEQGTTQRFTQAIRVHADELVAQTQNTDENQNGRELDRLDPSWHTGGVPESALTHTRDALQDYQMQLLLLEKHNWKRLWRAMETQRTDPAFIVLEKDMNRYSHLAEQGTEHDAHMFSQFKLENERRTSTASWSQLQLKQMQNSDFIFDVDMDISVNDAKSGELYKKLVVAENNRRISVRSLRDLRALQAKLKNDVSITFTDEMLNVFGKQPCFQEEKDLLESILAENQNRIARKSRSTNVEEHMNGGQVAQPTTVRPGQGFQDFQTQLMLLEQRNLLALRKLSAARKEQQEDMGRVFTGQELAEYGLHIPSEEARRLFTAICQENSSRASRKVAYLTHLADLEEKNKKTLALARQTQDAQAHVVDENSAESSRPSFDRMASRQPGAEMVLPFQDSTFYFNPSSDYPFGGPDEDDDGVSRPVPPPEQNGPVAGQTGNHLRKTQQDVGSKEKFLCDIVNHNGTKCGKSYKRENNLRQHQKKVHEQARDTPDQEDILPSEGQFEGQFLTGTPSPSDFGSRSPELPGRVPSPMTQDLGMHHDMEFSDDMGFGADQELDLFDGFFFGGQQDGGGGHHISTNSWGFHNE
ncbi:hypothetical protein B0T22DRAFT_489623 [Podospora appendiculata]|uniref:C2H2-type domain-containing protein n=1 Tax=Podospora appendiculata TaxID=314037 RepID=A0AAE0X837_9PEZI|nr:hypothetical protein B0T22DRAFT_489623 [Podospora appendiculata]